METKEQQFDINIQDMQRTDINMRAQEDPRESQEASRSLLGMSHIKPF